MSEGDVQPIFSPRGTGRVLQTPIGGPIELKALGEETGGAVTSFETLAPPGEGPPLHVHDNDDEFIYFLDSSFRVRLRDEVMEAPPGSFVFIPKGVPHTWQNAGTDHARMLVCFTPASPGMQWFFERAAEASEGGPDPSKFAELGGEAGMTVLGPPLAQSHPLG